MRAEEYKSYYSKNFNLFHVAEYRTGDKKVKIAKINIIALIEDDVIITLFFSYI